MKRYKKDAKHCKKGGKGGYDVCWAPNNLCSCVCQMCSDASFAEEYETVQSKFENLKNVYPEAMNTFVINNFSFNIQKAIEQLHSLAVEYVHRKNGENYAEIDDQDLQEVIDILNGK